MCLLFKPFNFFFTRLRLLPTFFFRYSPQKNTERSSATWRKLSNSNTLLPWDFKNHIFCTMKKETEIQKFFPFLVSFLNVWKLVLKKLDSLIFSYLIKFLVWMSAVCLHFWTRTVICCHLHFGAKIQVFHSHNWKMSLFGVIFKHCVIQYPLFRPEKNSTKRSPKMVKETFFVSFSRV